MWRPLSSPPPPLSPQVLADVKAAFEGLRPGTHHPASDLYRRYKLAMERQGREPVHQMRFGKMLIEFGALRKAKWDSDLGYMVSGWII